VPGWGRVTIDLNRGEQDGLSICETGALDGRMVVTAWFWASTLWAKLNCGVAAQRSCPSLLVGLLKLDHSPP
jgi:hypothetical protein